MAGTGFLLSGVAAAAKDLLLNGVLAHWGGPHWFWGPWPWMTGDWGVWGWIHFLAGIGIRVLFIVALIAALRWLFKAGKGGKGASGALEILKERYAKGEVSKEEFERMRRDILA
jgi:putative membrane protein